MSVQAIQASRKKRRQVVGNALCERKEVVARYASPEHRKMRALSEGAATLVPAHSDEGIRAVG
ncbi:hypothetical protein KSC_025570 [Ktedonobacter sp. SOSP1-52]|uniref:hypothetical protein n=1 Tax=Ktedonobacter sp. SOSP1-52 TaxID=2778366 RepID=UPI0019166BBE|nr:hypothetical protein [Ktedonobacter sp. SOSP1-52]GHO63665.1 hypothetical protein KSC_025570 [Ktedonobacter sp. SOSP1-52]